MKADELKKASSKVSKSVEKVYETVGYVILSAKPHDKSNIIVNKDAFRKMTSALKQYEDAKEEFVLFVKEQMKIGG